jgi:hypothetical protein
VACVVPTRSVRLGLGVKDSIKVEAVGGIMEYGVCGRVCCDMDCRGVRGETLEVGWVGVCGGGAMSVDAIWRLSLWWTVGCCCSKMG